MYGIENSEMISVHQVFLDEQNPRHDPYDSQDDAIEYLCREQQVLAIAKDISRNGLNPLELFALIAQGENSYFAAEGNRRLCALKLLNDPDLAPANQRNEFRKAAETWEPIDEIFAVIFENRDVVRLWLDRIHAGSNDGRGRRQWSAEQKARNSGYSKNDLALTVLDVGEKLELISKEQRKGRLSTVQRYIGNPLMRDVLGFDGAFDGDLTTDLSENDFSLIFSEFMKDIHSKEITTRDNAEAINAYSKRLRNLEGLTGGRVKKRVVSMPSDVAPTPEEKKIIKPQKITKIAPNDDLQLALRDIPSYKLEQLYYSLCSLSLSSHTPIITVGAWSFLETLTAVCGRNSGTDFHTYLAPTKLNSLGLGDKKDTKSIRDSVKRISDLGNSTKHNKTSSAFNGEQLANDFLTMEGLLVALAKNAKGKT